MTRIRRNLVANYLGQGWSAVMGLAFIPVYIRHLGVEAYGLIGLFAVLQAWSTLLDAGMTPTLNREMARFSAGARSAQSIRNLLRSLELVCFGLAALIALGVWSFSGYVATGWVQAAQLPQEVIAQAISIMAIVVALRFCESIYAGSLIGLQRQVWYSSVNAVLATLRYGGAVGVLVWVSPTIHAFFLWQGTVSLLAVALLAASVRQALPKAPARAKFSREALAGIRTFAASMMGITFLALLLTQVDKMLLSRLLTLEQFGYYTLAATVAGALYLIISPVTQAVYPRMVELATSNDQAVLAALYHRGAQLVTVLTAPAAMLLSFFAHGVIFMWSGDMRLADSTAPILSVLVVGTFLHGLMWMPYHCRLAHGWTSLTLIVNAVAVLVLVPALLWVVPHYGAVGAAWIWVVLNAGYVLVPIQLMHRRLLPDEKWRWYVADVLLPAGGATVVLLVAGMFQPAAYQDRLHWVVFLALAGCTALAASAALADRVRSRLLALMTRTRQPSGIGT